MLCKTSGFHGGDYGAILPWDLLTKMYERNPVVSFLERRECAAIGQCSLRSIVQTVISVRFSHESQRPLQLSSPLNEEYDQVGRF
jgi:hypothetical protein